MGRRRKYELGTCVHAPGKRALCKPCYTRLYARARYQSDQLYREKKNGKFAGAYEEFIVSTHENAQYTVSEVSADVRWFAHLYEPLLPFIDWPRFETPVGDGRGHKHLAVKKS